jgi:hypothetical protein
MFPEIRKRDINLNIAISDHSGQTEFYVNGSVASSMDKEYAESNLEGYTNFTKQIVNVDTLGNIAKKYIPKDLTVHFCSIDVESHEKYVLLGNDWDYFRPWIFCVESTHHRGEIFNRTDKKWDYLLLKNGYSIALKDSNNSYYVLSEKKDIIENLIPEWYILQLYDIKKYGKSQNADSLPLEDIFYR